MIAWTGRGRIAVTFSSEYGPHSRDAMAQSALAALEGAQVGWTLTEHIGGWAGETEYGATIATVTEGPPRIATVMPACEALWACGCEALQIETHGPDGYRVYELRKDV